MYLVKSRPRLFTIIPWLMIIALFISVLLPIIAGTTIIKAASLTERKITLETSQASATSVTYTASFKVATSANLGGVVIDVCTSPIIDTACTAATAFDWTTGGLGTVTGWTGATHDTGATADDANTIVFSDAAPDAKTAGDLVTIEWTAATNPSTTGTFYARIVTYDDGVKGDTYLSIDADNGGVHTDDGSVALSTAAQITVTAAVQEKLVFCVGTTDPGAGCSGSSGTSVDLGILSESAINKASTGSGIAYAQVSSNAVNGVIVTYIGDNLKVTGAVCGITDIEGSESTTDKCLNQDANPDAGAGAIVAGTEEWGLAVTSSPNDGATTDQLAPAVAYDYDTANEFGFNPNTATTLASASGPVDSEQLNIDIAATIAGTTPTGIYQTTLTFVATGTY